ncbi:hypothetical protein [Pararhodospirillum oryzae]|uniref:EAL domain-containing protein n=1 Tax=Pararhodospirillum oryzae TaxID=478448 RepID=A0A512HAR2_9PROT|nr:hypothetical protein [Pararhodospirillum oryzae]GEO82525.1 hypothetical protein ROR02_26560 [Pararhodospirillum oryzae]
MAGKSAKADNAARTSSTRASAASARARSSGGGFGHWLASKLRSAAEYLAPAPDVVAPAPGPRRTTPLEVSAPHTALDEMLKAYLTDRGDSAVSKIHIISLDEMKQAFGDDWERLSNKAMMITESIIRKNLTGSDYYFRQSDDSYLLLLSGLGVHEAAVKVQAIATLIRRRLLGEKAENMHSFGVKAAVVTLSELLEQGTIPSLENITNILDERLPEEIGVRTFRRRGDGGGLTPQARVYESLDVRYRPVWNPASQIVFAYQIQPYRTTDYGVFAGQWTLNGGYLDPLGIEVDKKVIEEALRVLRASHDDRDAPVTLIPLHFKSFTGQARNEMFSIISKLLSQARQELVAFELVGLLDSLPVNRLPQIVAALSRLSRFVAVRAVPDQFDHIKGSLNGVRLLGLDLNDISRHGADAASRGRAMLDFARFARDQGIASYIWDMRTIDEVRSALDLGFANLSGVAVSTELTEPRGLYELSVQRVIR